MSKPLSAFVVAAMLAGTASAQEKPAEKPRKPAGAALKVQVVYSRFQGDKKVSSMPYTLLVTADEKPTFVRFGVQIPIQTMVQNQSMTTFKDASTNLDCSAETLPDGRYKLALQVEQSSLFMTDAERRAVGGPSAVASVPLLHSFRSSNVLYLRDGQSTQYVAAADPTNGELLKVDVSLAVLR